MEVNNSKNASKEVKYQKSYFDVLGLCCSSEAVLVERILKPLDGIQKVSVIVPSKTVIVVHDDKIISQIDIVKILNQASLEANIRAYGTDTVRKKWPSPYILMCGSLLVISLFKPFFHPLRWMAVAAVAVGLPPIILRSIAAIRRYTLDINILMLIAIGGAIALKDYLEAGFIVFLFITAEWLESRASLKATDGMSALMSMVPRKAVLAETGDLVDVEDVKVNTNLAVKAGEMIPIDGIVVEGQSEVDERSLTGESFPVGKQPQSLVWAGTLNIDGYMTIRTTALAEQSAVTQMTRMVEEAQNSRSKTQRFIDSCTKYYTPAVVVMATGVAVIPLLMRIKNPKKWFQLALVLLVSACPCALVLSTPVASFCALLIAARTGILIKGADVLEALAKVKIVAFDKTGTITKGEFTIIEFRPIDTEVTQDKLLYWVSSIESKSSHPMASALVEYARSKNINPKPQDVQEFQIYPGEGIYGEIDGENVFIGNKRIAARASCETVPIVENMKGGVTYGYIVSDARLMGTFVLSDNCRVGASQSITELRSLNIETAMLTGDSTEAALHARDQLGHPIEIHAELLPKDKVQLIEELKGRKGFIAMVGDGINDAPALAKADVGFSMGISGTAVATETSHITLMSNDMRKIPKAIRLARKTYRKIIENIIFSVTTKIIIVAVAFAGHPILWAAVLADVGTCLLVILNSMMLLRTRDAGKKLFCGSLHSASAEETKRAGHCVGSKCQSRRSKENKCCSSSKKAPMAKCKNAGNHVIGDCKSPSSCGQLKKGIGECNHHDHTVSKEVKEHSSSSNQDYHHESSSHSYCCQESTMHRTCSVNKDLHQEPSSHFHHCQGSLEQKASNGDEHLITISNGVGRYCHESDEMHSCNLDSHNTHAKEDCCNKKNQHGTSEICGNISKKKTGRGCIKNEGHYCDGSQKNLSSNQDNHKSHLDESAYSSNIQHEASKICTDISNGGCSNDDEDYTCDISLEKNSCNQDSYKSYGEEDCCSTRAQGGLSKVCGDTPKNKNSGCCDANQNQCAKTNGCPSLEIMESRATGMSCRHHNVENGKKDDSCPGRMPHLPEIVIE